jgi:hypothetical protein
MMMSHEHLKAGYLEFVSGPSFCDIKTVMFQKWGQFLSSVEDDTYYCLGYEFSCV